MKRLRKALALLLCLTMLGSMRPAFALAEGTEEALFAEEEPFFDLPLEFPLEEPTDEISEIDPENMNQGSEEPESTDITVPEAPEDLSDGPDVQSETESGEIITETDLQEQPEDAQPDAQDSSLDEAEPQNEEVDLIFEEDLILSLDGIAVSGTSGGISWSLDVDGTLTISGTGPMNDYSVGGPYAPWYNYRDSIIRAVVEPGITNVGEAAFYECSNLTDVTLPEGLLRIEDNAFDSCSALPGLEIPNGVTRIGVWAFWNCSSLLSITIPASVTAIGGQTFLECTALTDICVDPGNGNFASRDGVLFDKEVKGLRCYPAGKPDTTYTIPEGVTWIADNAFSYCRFLTHVVFPETVGSLGNTVFQNATALKEVTLPSHMSSIYPSAFEGCIALENIKIPEGIKVVNNFLFRDCTSLKTVTIPSSVTSIVDNEVFTNCSSLISIDVHPDNSVYCSQNGVLFDKSKTKLIQYPAGKPDTNYSIPKQVTSITARSFENCAAIESVKIPNGVTWIPAYTFNSCSSLTTVTIPVSVTSIGESAFNRCSSITQVNYGGEYYQWNRIKIGAYNSYLERAYINYAYVDPEDEEIGNNAVSYSELFGFRHDENSNYGASCVYKDSFFDGSSWNYSHDLAKMSLSMAMSAFTKGGTQGFDTHVDASAFSRNELLDLPPGNVVELMQNCGFTKIAVNEEYLLTTEYGAVNDGNNIGVCIGAKTLTEEGTYLIAVAVRGGGYGCEWIGDFNAYNPNHYSYHIGFERGANEVVSQLRDYISENSIVGKLKIWICGYSRGAAVANLTAAKVAEGALNGLGCTLEATDLFGYLFETPQGTKNPNAKASQYNGIWNIINPVDIVTYVAMDDWGYTRYGHDMKLPSKYTIAKQYRAYCDKVLERFNDYHGSDYSVIPDMRNQYWEVIKLKNALPQILGDDGSGLTSVFMSEIQDWFKGESVRNKKFSDVLNIALSLFVTNPALFTAGGAAIAGYAVYTHVWDIATAHFPELILAWMNTIGSANVTEDGFVTFAISNCPVDLAVYAEGALQMRFVGDEVFYEEGAFIEGSIDADGQKVVCIPEDTDVQLEIEATEDGTFNYSLQEYDLRTNHVTEVVNYYDVEIREGDSLRAEVNNATTGQDHLYGDDGNVIPADDELSGGSIAGYTVRVSAEGEGTAEGGGYYIAGEFAQVTATAGEGAVFQGWYDGDALVSQQIVYRFRPTGNVALAARFRSDSLPVGYRLSEAEKAVSPGESFLLAVVDSETGAPAVPSGTVTWTSSNTGVAKVSSNGTVTAVSVGAATIHAETENDELSADCNVKVLFEDVADASSYFYRAVYWAAGRGVTSGTSPTTFSPNKDCTRGQIVTFLWKSMGSPEPRSTENPFTDVKESDYFFKPVLWAKENGITSGKTATTFAPGAPCTRGQIVTFLWIAKGRPEPTSTENPFTDVKTEDYFFKPVLWAKENEITFGTSATTFSPGKTCTRAQAMTFLWIANGRP